MSISFDYIEAYARTDIGCKRKNNEDAILSLPVHGLFCVADGMGGARDGEVASQAVVDALKDCFVSDADPVTAITAASLAKTAVQALNQASSWIERRSRERGIHESGSTAVIMVFDRVRPDRAMVVHVGDSRAYRFRNEKLTQLSIDHSLANQLGVSDEHDLPPMLRGVITRAVGLSPQVDAEETAVHVEPGDIYMLCSDGLTCMLSDTAIAAIFKIKGKGELRILVDALVDQALELGGRDNVSVILIRVADDLPTAT